MFLVKKSMISLVYNTMKQARNRHGRTCFHCSELGEIFGLCKWITHEKAKTKIELREGNKINALKIDLDVLGTLKREELVFKQPIKLYLKSLGNSFDTYDRHEKDIISALEKNTKLSVWCTQKSYWKTLKDNHTRLFGKIGCYIMSKRNSLEIDELYDLINDPGEMKNLINDSNYNSIEKELREESKKLKKKYKYNPDRDWWLRTQVRKQL